MHFPQLLFDVPCHCVYPLLTPSAYHACVCHAKAHSVIQIIQMLNHEPVAFCSQAAEGRDTICYVYIGGTFSSFILLGGENNERSLPFSNKLACFYSVAFKSFRPLSMSSNNTNSLHYWTVAGWNTLHMVKCSHTVVKHWSKYPDI